MDPFTVPLTVGRMGRAASQVRPPALVFGAGVEGRRGWFRVSRWRLKVCSRVLRLYEALPLVRSTAPLELVKNSGGAVECTKCNAPDPEKKVPRSNLKRKLSPV